MNRAQFFVAVEKAEENTDFSKSEDGAYINNVKSG